MILRWSDIEVEEPDRRCKRCIPSGTLPAGDAHMSQSPTQPMDPYTTTLLRVAEYLSRPQQFVTVAEAQATFRHTRDMAHQASVVLTTDGEPAGALVPFATLEAMRAGLQHLLVEAMET